MKMISVICIVTITAWLCGADISIPIGAVLGGSLCNLSFLLGWDNS